MTRRATVATTVLDVLAQKRPVSLSGKWRGSCSAMWPVARLRLEIDDLVP